MFMIMQALSGKAEEVGDLLASLKISESPPSHFEVKGLYVLPLRGPEKGGT